ncbi:hypothetical protein SAMN04488137_4330 [Fictibacillus solisalsi]|uniref:Uncharacterized protein n=2 Tax=Fictibacillus solisalsi TaxID=459525 RepID=A0A1H0B0B6_9BACL|nr:hypothetical protein SAMN04488137_4330 [Fictibacillus solisalsi]
MTINMMKKMRSMVAVLVIIGGCAAYMYSSLMPPLEIQTERTSAVQTWLYAENTGRFPIKIEAFYINNNEVPPEASMKMNTSWAPARGQKISAGGKKKVRILHDFPAKRIVIVYRYGGIPFTRLFPVKMSVTNKR